MKEKAEVKVGDIVQHHIGFAQSAQWVTLGLVVDIPECDWSHYACILTRDGTITKRPVEYLEIANEREQKERNERHEKRWAWSREK